MAESDNTTLSSCSCGCPAGPSCETDTPGRRRYIPPAISFIMLAAGIAAGHFIPGAFFTGHVRTVWYILAYLPVGLPVMREALRSIRRKDVFNELTLMTVATLGAFFIGEYPEGVGVMLFYSVGELFQESAVNKAQRNIKALLDIRPDSATVYRKGNYETVEPADVGIGETIRVKAGERVPLDGKMISPHSSFNTSALTGESKPETIRNGEKVLAGMVNLDKVIEIEVEKEYKDSSLSRILNLVQDAASRKAKTELFIRKFARVYTPAVFFLALAVVVLPYLFTANYVFDEWLYRGLVFLVISCPCALVISVPLGYFGGIGAASRNGILFKGASFLDLLPSVHTIVTDKTGTLSKGVFKVQEINAASMDNSRFMQIAAGMESLSGHPIAKAITEYALQNNIQPAQAGDVREIAGRGLEGRIDGKTVLAGNAGLMSEAGIGYDKAIDLLTESVVIIAIDNEYAGYITISDEMKEDAPATVSMLKNMDIRTIMLSGDKDPVVQKAARDTGIDVAHGNLLPEEKVQYVEALMRETGKPVAFVGDGINDAPVLAVSDIGIVMGGMGADAAIEIADIVIQTDHPSKIITAIKIAGKTKSIIRQNITVALGAKILIMILGITGHAGMWMAVFADVGIALLAILNAVRILYYNVSVPESN